MYNFQHYRHVQALYWVLDWTWAKKEKGPNSRGFVAKNTLHLAGAASLFQISVGDAGTTNQTVKLPMNFTLKEPRPGYTYSPAKIIRPTKFITRDKRRVVQTLSKF
ncbi:COBRA-like protein [Trema orientale]|uniref:COBRA-like protein n=1 Tax=Trema orientale TaxID=63057 RepID=A0A2P5EBX9_TREOI|nr:COBRA-like protein [Trema orientale]